MKTRTATLCALLAGTLLLGASRVLAADTTGVTGNTIKIGVPGPFSGDASSYSKAEIGIHAYFDYVNDHGGINGRKIVVDEVDTGCDETKGITAVKKLIYEDKVFLIDGISCSGVGLAVKPIVLAAKVPLVIAQAVNQNISQPVEPYIFHAVPTSYDAARSIIDFAMSRPGPHKIAIVSHSNEWGKGYHDPEVAYLRDKYGLAPTIDLAMERGSVDATPQVLKIKNSGADFMILNLYETETAIFLRDAYKYGLTIPSIGGYGTDLEDTLKRVGNLDAVKDYYVLNMFVGRLDSPAMKKWGEMIHKYYPNEELTAFSFVGLGSAIVTAHALQACGRDVTRERFIAEMNKIRDFKTGVLASDVSFTPQDHQGAKKSAVAGFLNGKVTLFASWGRLF
jgi:branched-chain amino acid transport system substrate-binding protein